jgi:lysophospholipase L1-like esterase
VSGAHGALRLLCYGDSNTWGFSPRDGSRFPPGVRWPGVLAGCLRPRATVLEDGVNGRTLLSPGYPGHPRGGGQRLAGVLEAYKPLHALILFLGINDLFSFEGLTARELGDGLRGLLRGITASAGDDGEERLRADRVVVMPPVPVNEQAPGASLYARQVEASRELSPEYRRAADDCGCLFFDPGVVIAASSLDGVHLEAEEHVRLGEALCAFLPPRLFGRFRAAEGGGEGGSAPGGE